MSPRPLLDRILAAVLIALAALVIAEEVAGQGWAALPARALAIGLALALMPRFGLREWVLCALAAALALGLATRPGGMAALAGALDKGAYFTAFIVLMMVLREGALTSDAVQTVGRWVTLQPPGRRFAATWAAGHVAGILMNFGAISLLAPLIQRGVRAEPVATAEDQRRMEVRERRQLTALIRGFGWVFAWAPTTLTQVIILGAIPGLDPGRAILVGLALSALMFTVGWAEDRVRWGRPRARASAAGPFPLGAGRDLAAVYALLIAGALAVQALLGTALPQALMTVAPVLLAGWVASQNRARPDAAARTGARLSEIATVALPRMARDAFNLGAAGFIGIAAARLAPVAAIAAWTETAGIPARALVAALPALIVLGGQVALSPMMMVVFLAAVVSALPAMPAPAWIVAAALGAGWALSMTACPNATGPLLIAGAAGLPPTTLTWRWNGLYSLVVLALLVTLAWAVVP